MIGKGLDNRVYRRGDIGGDTELEELAKDVRFREEVIPPPLSSKVSSIECEGHKIHHGESCLSESL